MLQLIVIKLAEILRIQLTFSGIRYSCKAIQLHIIGFHLLYRFNDVAQLADTRRLD